MTDQSVERGGRRPATRPPEEGPAAGDSPYARATTHARAARLAERAGRRDHGAGNPSGGPAGGADRGTRGRLRRRALVAGLAGTGTGAALWYVAARGLPGRDGSLSDVATPPAPPSGERDAAFRAADGGGFANRDESYARSVGVAEPAEPVQPEADPPSTLFPTAGEAAAATEVSAPTLLATDDSVRHLVRRTTFGPTPELVDEVQAKGVDAWIGEQLDPTSIDDGEADQVWGQFPATGMSPAEIQATVERFSWAAMTEYGRATLGRQIWSRRQLFEVMADFWANHLNVSTPGAGGWDTAPSYHNDVIRQHALGSFTDMLLAAGRHPAMLRYLNNDSSTKESVNENLGRELLELHTVGVGSGYTEDDVRNSAYTLTGRTVVGQDDEEGRQEGSFVYDAGRHWTGEVRVLDFQHANASAEEGLEVGNAYLRYLASHPATARTIAHKLAVRFVSDDPPDVLVDRLASAYTDSETQIVPVLETLFRSGEFWAAVGQKTRRPLENVVATARVLGVRPGDDTTGALEAVYWWLGNAGHRPLAWPAPNGYPDVAVAWRSAGGLLEVWNAHRRLVRQRPEGANYTPATELVGDRPRATAGEYVDSLCQRLCLQTFRPEHRSVLLGFLEADESTPSDQVDLEAMANHVTPLVLDSPYFALR